MTAEELDAVIAEIILPQEKPRSTQNSHRRKQWENRRNWQLCTKWKSCKVAEVKTCKLVGQYKNSRRFNPLCYDCFCFLNGPGFFGRLGGISFNCEDGRFKKYSYNCKILRKYLNRYVRHRKGEIGNYGVYKKLFEYAWDCV